MKIPHFADKKDLYEFLITNKQVIEMDKNAEMKRADAIAFNYPSALSIFDTKSNSFKAAPVDQPIDSNASQLLGRLVINTTNWFDTYADVHIPGIWKKSVAENKTIMHLQEHVMAFDHIISAIVSGDLKVKVEKLPWSELNMPYPGTTEALVFYSTIKRSRNAYMFEQYMNKYVTNHSVGMRYVSYVMCINDEDYGAEFEAWQKYFPMIVNASAAEDQGYFWAVKEARVIEGSAVPIGANIMTPTLSIESQAGKSGHLKNEPAIQATQIAKYLAENFKL